MFRLQRLRKMEDSFVPLDLAQHLITEKQPPLRDYQFQVTALRERFDLSNVPRAYVFGFKVRKASMLTNVLDAIWSASAGEIVLPLRIEIDEPAGIGQDLGGIAQEVLQLCWEEALKPDYGE